MVQSISAIRLKDGRSLKNANKTEKTIKLFVERNWMFFHEEQLVLCFKAFPMFEDLFGLVGLALGIPETWECTHWTILTDGMWRRHYDSGFNGIRYMGNTNIYMALLFFVIIEKTSLIVKIRNVYH